MLYPPTTQDRTSRARAYEQARKVMALTRPRTYTPDPSPEKPAYTAYNLHNFRQLPEIARLTPDQQFEIEVAGTVLPFKTNNYVVEQLIDWERVPNDPIFVLNFPMRDTLLPEHYDRVATLLRHGAPKGELDKAVYDIRMELNPHPAGQLEHNVPMLGDERLTGMQHKYRETVLFFPSAGQTCHAYCTFCFRWPQFVGLDDYKFAMRESDLLVEYLHQHKEVTNVLVTGGDPLVMRTRKLTAYLRPLLQNRPSNLISIRIGTKAISYWPYRFTADEDADELIALFRDITASGLHLSIMAHVNHPKEVSTGAARHAIERIRATGAEIRTQSPLMRGINDSAEVWSEMWRKQVQLGCIPYYMFIARDTGAQHYFSVPLVRAHQIFRDAHNGVSGLARTVRGPSMSTDPGKVEVTGVTEVAGKKVIALRMLQGRNPDWALRPFFAEYDDEAVWLSDLKPAFGEERFFYEDELGQMYAADAKRANSSSSASAV